MIAIRIPAQPAGSRYKRKTKKGSQEAEANKGQKEILHGGIDQAVNVNQVSDTLGDQKVVNRLKHRITLSFKWMNLMILFIQTDEKSSAHPNA